MEILNEILIETQEVQRADYKPVQGNEVVLYDVNRLRETRKCEEDETRKLPQRTGIYHYSKVACSGIDSG